MPHTMDAYSATEASVQQAPRVEQFTAAPATRHELCAFQASIENISIWELVNHGTLWLLLNFAPKKYSYLLTYLLTYMGDSKNPH